eukprot:gene9115-1637_t
MLTAATILGIAPLTGALVPCGGKSTSSCPADCCASGYSPDGMGCTTYVGDLPKQSVGCGDALGPANGTTVCCKMVHPTFRLCECLWVCQGSFVTGLWLHTSIAEEGPPLPPSTSLPNVLIIGDSVSIGYTSLATQNVPLRLKSKALVQHGPWDVSDGGAGDTATGVACLDNWLVTHAGQRVKWDLITFNFGLHDMTNTSQCEDLYRSQLTNITTRLRATGAKLLYLTTTPYMPLRQKGNMVVEQMNNIARSVVAGHAQIVDLYKTVTDTCGAVYNDCPICRMHPCSYHYNDQGMSAQAGVVADAISSALESEN